MQVGTTSSSAVDPLPELGQIAKVDINYVCGSTYKIDLFHQLCMFNISVSLILAKGILLDLLFFQTLAELIEVYTCLCC